MKNEVCHNVNKFIFGGKAEFIIMQENPYNGEITSAHYKVNICKNDPSIYYVQTEQLNSKQLIYHGILHFNKNGKCSYFKGKNVNTFEYNEKAINALIWVLSKSVSGLPPYVHVLHVGKCSRCGRRLTDMESILCGMGPECRKKV